jgi:actin-like ATPase involved in cell morphogenesis
VRQVTAVVDFGTSHTVAVVSGPDSPARLVRPGGRPWLPSAVFWTRDGRAVVGAEAFALARTEPARLERNPKARIGEPEVLLGDSVVATTNLVRAVLVAVIAEAVRVAGAPVQHLVLTHPADWGSTRLGAFMSAAQGLVPRLSTVPEPVGAAAWFAGRHDMPVGATVAVLDFGAGTCDAAVVRRESTGLTVVDCAGLPDLGGEDLDQRMIEHLRRARPVLGQLLDGAERVRPVAVAELPEISQLRENVRRAKEELSERQQVEVPLPGGLPDALLTRTELETSLEPELSRAVELLAGAVRSAGLSGTDLAAVHLVGGSSRIPLLARMLRARLPVPVQLDEMPELVVALGAHAVLEPTGEGQTAETPRLDSAVSRGDGPVAAGGSPVPAGRSRRTAPVVAVAALVAVLSVVATLFGTGAFDHDLAGSPTAPSGAVALLNVPTPQPGKKIENPGSPVGALPTVKQGEYAVVRHFPDRPDTEWRLDSFDATDAGNRQLVQLGNKAPAGYRWVFVRTTERPVKAVDIFIPSPVYLVDDRGLMISSVTGVPKLPQGCPGAFDTGPAAAGAEIVGCSLYAVPAATPIVQVAVASLSHQTPTNLYVQESIPNGAKVDVTGGSQSGEAVELSDTLAVGTPVPVRVDAFGADLAVVDVIEDISAYFEVEYSNDKVIGLPGTRAVLVRVAARLREPIDGARLPVPDVSVVDDRGAVVHSPFRAQRHECIPLAPTGQLDGTLVFCALVALPPNTPVRAVRVAVNSVTVAGTWLMS